MAPVPLWPAPLGPRVTPNVMQIWNRLAMSFPDPRFEFPARMLLDSRLAVWGILILALALQFSPVDAADLSNDCRAKIDSRIPGWHLSPPPPDLAAYAKPRKLETNIAHADLDGDGTRDTAVLVLAPNGAGQVQYIAICLERKAQPQLHLIREPYCGDGIRVAPKGQTVYDYQTGKNVIYPTNGIHAYCFEKAGGTYLYRNGRFELVVDSD